MEPTSRCQHVPSSERSARHRAHINGAGRSPKLSHTHPGCPPLVWVSFARLSARPSTSLWEDLFFCLMWLWCEGVCTPCQTVFIGKQVAWGWNLQTAWAATVPL